MDKNKDKNEKQVCRALITTTTGEGFDFEAVAVPAENGQIRYSWENDEYFNQVLRAGKENINSARLDSGLPLFDNHPWDNSAENTLGITTDYFFDERGLVVRAKLGARADEALRSDIKNGIMFIRRNKIITITADFSSRDGMCDNFQPFELRQFFRE